MNRVYELERRWQNLWNLYVLYRRRGADSLATKTLERAAAVSLSYVGSSASESLVHDRSKRVNDIFAELAWVYARDGDPKRALAAMETIRALTVRLYTMSDEEHKRRSLDTVVALTPRTGVQLEDGEWRFGLMTQAEPADESLVLSDIMKSIRSLNAQLMDVPTAIVSLTGTPGRGMSAIICDPGERITAVQWELDSNVSRPTVGFDSPGPFRERRLRAVSTECYEPFFGPVDRVLKGNGTERIVLSAPFWLSTFPFEALSDGTSFVADHYQLLYVPSVAVAADLSSKPRSPTSRMLIVGYSGEDLPWSRVEETALHNSWDKDATVVSHADYGKAVILSELAGEYDIIHFCCHASYDSKYPLKSALHLVPDPSDDRHRIDAWDLMSDVKFSRTPTVSLSACSSGVMDSSDINGCYGLPGGFMRAGARSIIGTRWPVYDDTAAETVTNTYEMQRATAMSTSQCLNMVSSQMRETRGIEDWAAFGYMGLP